MENDENTRPNGQVYTDGYNNTRTDGYDGYVYNPGNKAETYSPLWNSDVQLPRDRATLNAWCRSFYALNADINRIIEQHVKLIVSCFELLEGTSKIKTQIAQEQLGLLNIKSVLTDAIREYFILGEVFMYSCMDEAEGIFDRVIIQNPDYILVKNEFMDKKYFLRPDEKLQRICHSDDQKDLKAQSLLDPVIVNCVKNRENIPLNSFYFYHASRKMSPYEIRGTSFLVPLFRTLIKLDHADAFEVESLNKTVRACLYDTSIQNRTEADVTALFELYDYLTSQLEYWINKKILTPVFNIQNTNKKEYNPTTSPRAAFNKKKMKKVIGVPVVLVGPTGATGPVGPIGPTGATGATGPVGPTGLRMGLVSLEGITGASGPSGGGSSGGR